MRQSTPERDLTVEGYAVLVVVARRDLWPIPLPPELVVALTPYRSEEV